MDEEREKHPYKETDAAVVVNAARRMLGAGAHRALAGWLGPRDVTLSWPVTAAPPAERLSVGRVVGIEVDFQR